ncbi:MAG: presqualene diphosphate synthase HpnD [Hyphomicrobiales bacterium]
MTSAPTAEDHAEVAAIVQNASTSFFGAMRMLPLERRQAIYAVYAFCRVVDDIADDDDILPEKRKIGLDEWRARISAVYSGKADDAISKVLAFCAPIFALNQADFIAVIDGMQMDTIEEIVAPDRATFELYCDRVACAVGRLCVKIFGETSERGIELANAQGRALQITNILRDVHEDADRGRFYLPNDLLKTNDILSSTPREIIAHPNYVRVWRDMASEAASWFATADSIMGQCDPKTMRPSRIMLEVYRRNLHRMMALSDAQIVDASFSKRLVKGWEKALIAFRYGFF